MPIRHFIPAHLRPSPACRLATVFSWERYRKHVGGHIYICVCIYIYIYTYIYILIFTYSFHMYLDCGVTSIEQLEASETFESVQAL